MRGERRQKGGKIQSANAPFHFFFPSVEINGKFSLKQSFLSSVERPGKSIWVTDLLEKENER